MKHALSALLVVVSLSLPASPASAGHTWGNYHWARTANPFTLLVVDSVTPDWDAELDIAMAEWSYSTVLDLTLAGTDDGKRTRRTCKMVTGQLRVCNDSYGYNGWLGLATIGIDPNGHIDRGTAQMNDSYASYWTIEGEKNHVMCQEIGHLFGLGHTSEDGSSQATCMDYSSDPASQWPNAHDYDTLLAIYESHVDAYDSFDSGSTGGGGGGDGGGCNAPAGKGCNKQDVDPGNVPLQGLPPMAIRVAGNDFEEIWVAPRSDDGLWLFHIRLAP